jgi:hypothetical protein
MELNAVIDFGDLTPSSIPKKSNATRIANCRRSRPSGRRLFLDDLLDLAVLDLP